jgi:hypothetical protein
MEARRPMRLGRTRRRAGQVRQARAHPAPAEFGEKRADVFGGQGGEQRVDGGVGRPQGSGEGQTTA